MIAETQQNLESRQAFQQLKTRLHRRMVDAIDLSKAGEMDESELRQQLQSLASHLCSMDEVKLSPEHRDVMVREIMDEIYGFGPLEPDVVSLEMRPANVEGKGEIDQRDLLKNSLRMRPDRIIVGEARGGEVLDLLQAMNTGHDGSMSTLHANDTRDALDRLEMMIALSGVELPTLVARQYIASAIHVLIHMTRLKTGERKVTRISELCGCRDGVYQIEDLFVYRMTGIDSAGRAQGSFYATGHEPEVLTRLAGRGVESPKGLFVARELAPNTEYTSP